MVHRVIMGAYVWEHSDISVLIPPYNLHCYLCFELVESVGHR